MIEKPRANAGPDKIIFAGTSAQLSGAVSGQAINFFWSPPVNINNTQLLKPTVTPPADVDYTLNVISNAGCGTAIDVVHVFVYNDVLIPTGFTPGNDGKNDTWLVPALSAFPNFTLSVYNRYGQVVFQAKNENRPWDGKYKGELQPTGVYVYIIDLKNGLPLLKGTITIIR